MKHQSSIITQGDKVCVDLSRLSNALVDISSGWRENCELQFDSDHYSIDFCENQANKVLFITAKEESPNTEERISITIPEYMDVDLIADNVDLKLKNKVF
jgi:hypothetical protein